MNRSRNSDRHATRSGHGFVWFTLISTGDVFDRLAGIKHDLSATQFVEDRDRRRISFLEKGSDRRGNVVERAECDQRMPAKIAVGGGHHRGRGHDDEYFNGKKDRTVPKREESVRYFCLCAERVRPVVDALELRFSFSGPKNHRVGVVIFS